MPQDLPQILTQIAHEYPLSQLVGAVIDIDGLIWVNAQSGHKVGDAILVQFSQWLGDCASRFKAHLVRIGGDEFLMLFPTRYLDEVVTIAQALVQECETLQMDYARPNYPRNFLAMSVGVLMIPPNLPEGLKELRERVAQALYEGEIKAGRDYSLTVILS